MQIFQAFGAADTHFFTQILQISIENSALFVQYYFIFGMLNSTTKHTETEHINEAKKSGKCVCRTADKAASLERILSKELMKKFAKNKFLRGTDIVERINEKVRKKQIFAWFSLIFRTF